MELRGEEKVKVGDATIAVRGTFDLKMCERRKFVILSSFLSRALTCRRI